MKKLQMRGGIASPNLLNICVDDSVQGEISGRVYHCYAEEPWEFCNVVQLIRYMEGFYDRIHFPEAAFLLRSFDAVRQQRREEFPEKIADRDYVMQQRGRCATFCVYVQYRQNATWQGVLCWVEKDKDVEFRSVLELIVLIDNALSMKRTAEEKNIE